MFLLLHCPRSVAELPGICVIKAKRQCNEKGKTNMVLPADSPRSVGVIAGD